MVVRHTSKAQSFSQEPEAIPTKDATPGNALELPVDCELTEIVRVEPEPDLLVSISTLPVAVAVTGDVESELKTLARLDATVETVDEEPYDADFVNPFTVTETVPVS
jgi:hypothetical protein